MRRRLLAGAVLLLGGNAGFTAWASRAAGPRIGVVVSDAWFDVAGVNPAAYELAIVRAGGAAVRIRPDDPLDGLEGVVLIGGQVLDPAELDLIRDAERRGLPVLGICRGAQAIATAYGGALGPAGSGHGVSINSLWAHDIRCEPDTRAARIFGTEAFRASSTHALGIADAGPRLRVSATSGDGGIEAVELPGPRFVVGVQWHPEWEGDPAPFRALVAAARS